MSASTQPPGRRRRRLKLAVVVTAPGGGGAAAALATGAAVSQPTTTTASASREANTSSVRYATTPTESGPINPDAVPLGDGYVSTIPKLGYVDSCQTHFGLGGASVNGPWINAKNHTWDYRHKLTVSGMVHWPAASYKITLKDDHRVIKFNDLPTDHTTGTFPIQTSDKAYQYDRNPNHIAAQNFDWTLTANPSKANHPGCLPMGPIGVLDDGVVLYNALDGGGRDAAAHEILDACGGHPDQSFTYHHHDIPPCILKKVKNGQTKLVGYALDGYGIYVHKNKNGTLPTNTQLDACHGTTSEVMWNGRLTRIYHYVATLEYPYTIGCYRGTPIQVMPAAP